jgi:hypothetical protein
MAKRKQTPNVLAEILGGADLGESLPGQSAIRTRHQPTPDDGLAWEYQVISFQDYRGWRPRYINGAEIKDWTSGPLLHEFLDDMGADGWELAAASSGERLYGSADSHQVYLKRPVWEAD